MELHASSLIRRILRDKAVELDPRDTSQLQSVTDKFSTQDYRTNKPVIWFLGTCQVSALIWALSHTSICDYYDLAQLCMNFHLAQFSLEEMDGWYKNLARIICKEDVVVFTPVYSNPMLCPAELTNGLRTIASRLIHLPYIVNTGIFPLYQTRSGWRGISGLDKNIAKQIVRGSYRFGLGERYSYSLKVLEERDTNSQFGSWELASFINNKMPHERIFYSYNHPSWPIYRYMSGRLGAFLGLEDFGLQLPLRCCRFDRFYLPDSAHPWALANSTITPFLSEHEWAWCSEAVDPSWREKYAVVLSYLLRIQARRD